MMLFFLLQQRAIQFQMSDRMKNEDAQLEKIILTASEYKESLVHSDEIYFKGKMYDIKSASFAGDTVELLVINDVEEEGIVARIKSLLNNTASSNSKIPHDLSQLSSLIYLQSFSDQVLFVPLTGIHCLPLTTLNILSHDVDVLSPPPWLV